MPIQIIPNNQKKSSVEQILSGINEAVPGIQNFLKQDLERQQLEQSQQAMKSFGEKYGLGDISSFSPEIQK